ncbi:hypothetical protein ACJIZ3_019080 [Penstemon smallii]|uniref:Uncharacterized protein n=1 Tax=Penstemon smallii TaxID=265156 RepID=A0ABD3T1E5_9LAMI
MYSDCGSKCGYRCSKARRHNMCVRACNTCCARCDCVPPGTSGNRDVCPCYANMKTHGGRLKCPCGYRCSKARRHNMCVRACNTCCARCDCVPPGTSGNRDVCPCYANMKTHGGRLKCP